MLESLTTTLGCGSIETAGEWHLTRDCHHERETGPGGLDLIGMGRAYKQEKRGRKLQHVHALLKACEHLGVRLIGSWPPLTVSHAATCGCKRLGEMRGHIINTANEQGVDSDLLYSMARQYTAIPQYSAREYFIRKFHAPPAPAQMIAQDGVGGEAFAKTHGPCLRCDTALRYGRLSPIHRSRGNDFLDLLGGLFRSVKIERIRVSFPTLGKSWFEGSEKHDWRSQLRNRRFAIRLSLTCQRSYRLETVRPYFCPDCLMSLEAHMDTQWAAWVDQCRREYAEAADRLEREREQERLRAERAEQRKERELKRRALAKEQSAIPQEVENAGENEGEPDISALDDKVFEAWIDAFMYPSDEAVKGLLRMTKKNDIATVAEAIRIAGKKRRELREDEARLKYTAAVLRNKRLEVESPELASRLRSVTQLKAHWTNQPRGTGYLPVWMLHSWLKSCSPDEIRAVMDLAGGHYRELREEMDSLIESKAQ